MNQVPAAIPQIPKVPNIPRGKAAHEAIQKNLGVLILEGSEDIYSDSGITMSVNPRGTTLKTALQKMSWKREDCIPNPSLCSLGFEAMLISALLTKQSVKKGWKQRN